LVDLISRAHGIREEAFILVFVLDEITALKNLLENNFYCPNPSHPYD